MTSHAPVKLSSVVDASRVSSSYEQDSPPNPLLEVGLLFVPQRLVSKSEPAASIPDIGCLLLVQYVPNTSQSSLIVGVRVRPLLKQEKAKEGRRDIIRVIDDRIVLVLDPDESKVSATN